MISCAVVFPVTSLFCLIALYSATKIEKLDGMVNEYNDSCVILFSFSPILCTGPITRVMLQFKSRKSIYKSWSSLQQEFLKFSKFDLKFRFELFKIKF